ncbi:MAG: sulfite exporter TauE/SafE family protein, partial [Clostridia bacterium]|nr:sulfite exporter TauE/SafE family protein [Clostridia bacterium]
MKEHKTLFVPAAGFAMGFLNGFLGAGGGMICVSVFKVLGFKQKDAHRNAVAVIWPMTALSAFFYIRRGTVAFADAARFLPAGILGALAGSWLIQKFPDVWLRRLFGGVMI